MPLIFAYGSNMDCAQMRERCHSAKFISIASLKDHQLAFTRKSKKRGCGVAGAITNPGKTVWGIVYDLTEDDLMELDKNEGIKSNSYVRSTETVFQNDDEARPLSVQVYFAVPQNNPPLPNQEYKDLILGGARFWNLPADYIAELEKIQVAS